MKTTALAALVAVAALAIAGCADGDPPSYITGLGADTTPTTAPSTTVSTTAPTTGSGVPATTTTVASTAVTDLVQGDCVVGAPFSGDTSGEATDARLADCADSHDGEVVGVVTYTQGPNQGYPGQDRVSAFAETQCAAAFETYVGAPYGTPALSMLSLWPTEDSWARGDRAAVCVAFDPAGPLTGSVAGTGG